MCKQITLLTISLLHENLCHIMTDLEYFKTHLNHIYLFTYLLGWGRHAKLEDNFQLSGIGSLLATVGPKYWIEMIRAKQVPFTYCAILIAFQTYS